MININLAENTINQYTRELGYFFRFLDDLHIEDIGEVKGIHIDMFNAQLIRNGNKPTTRSRKKSTIQKFFEYCVKREIIDKNPVEVIERIKITDQDRKKKDVITDKERTKILKNIEKKSRSKTKNRCLFNMFIFSAIRVSELCGMKWEDIDFKNKYITVRGKGRKTRKVPLVKEVEEDLRLLKKEQVPESDYVFTTKKTGRPMQPRSVHDLIKRIISESDINKTIGPHRLRATAATNYLREGVNLRYIQMLLGHSNLSTTMLYMNPDEEDMNIAIHEAAKNMKKKGKRK